MIKRIQYLDERVPITFIYGQNTWMDKSIGETIKKERQHCYVNIEVSYKGSFSKIKIINSAFSTQMIPNAGHHVFADQFEVFNDIVNKICQEKVIKIEE